MSLGDKKRLVVLLKERQGGSDPYAEALETAGLEARFVTVLSSMVTNQLQLEKALVDEKFSGIVITSQRAVEALRVVQEHRSSSLPRLPTCFAVGPSTSSALRELPYPPPLILGDASGTGALLAVYIADHVQANHQFVEAPLLYLTGDKRQDTVGNILRERGLSLVELEVYRTCLDADLVLRLTQALESARSASSLWIAFFSPSGVKCAWPTLQKSGRRFRVAAIGNATSDFLRQHCATCADAVAAFPTASDLARAIELAEQGEPMT